MFIVALCSTCGGVGRTTVTAELSSALGRKGRRVLAIDLDPQNMLGLHLGINLLSDGLATSSGDTWMETSWRTSDGVDFVPFGNPSADVAWQLEVELKRDPGWLSQRLPGLISPTRALCLLIARDCRPAGEKRRAMPPISPYFSGTRIRAVWAALMRFPEAANLRTTSPFCSMTLIQRERFIEMLCY